MKKVTAMLVASLFAMQICGVALASDDKGSCEKWAQKKSEKMMEKHLNKMSKSLNLTPEQKEKVSAIMKERAEKHKAEIQKAQDSMKAVRDESDQKIREVLTPEQAQKFDKQIQDRNEKMDKKMKKHQDDNDMK